MGVEKARRLALALTLMIANAAIHVDAAPVTESTELEAYDDEGAGCYYNFQHYGEGDRIMTNEPCLNCTCHNRMLMCYLRVCPFTKPIGQDCTVEKRGDQCCPIITCPDVRVDLVDSTTISSVDSTEVGHHDNYGCSINNRFYSDGAQVPSNPEKPCELCYCIRNMTACVMQECTLHVEGCTPVYQRGTCCPVRYSCEHPEEDGPLMIEDATTTTVRPTPGYILTTTMQAGFTAECTHKERIYADGASIATEQACEHCYCMKGDIVCAVQECGTPMENEGKNCTAIAPKAGQCCPDTYICEGDESATTISPIQEDDKVTSKPAQEPEEDRIATISPREPEHEKETTLSPEEDKIHTESPHVPKDGTVSPHVPGEEKIVTVLPQTPEDDKVATESPHAPEDDKATTPLSHEPEDDKATTPLSHKLEDDKSTTPLSHEPEDKATTPLSHEPEDDKESTPLSHEPEDDKATTPLSHKLEDDKSTTPLSHEPEDKATTPLSHEPEDDKATTPLSHKLEDDKSTTPLSHEPEDKATTPLSHEPEDDKATTAYSHEADELSHDEKATTVSPHVPKHDQVPSILPEADKETTESSHVLEEDKVATVLPEAPEDSEGVTESPHVSEDEKKATEKATSVSPQEPGGDKITTVSPHVSDDDLISVTEKRHPEKSDLPSSTESDLDVTTVQHDEHTTVQHDEHSTVQHDEHTTVHYDEHTTVHYDEHTTAKHHDEETSTRMTLDKTPQHRDDISGEVEHTTERKPSVPLEDEKHITEKPKEDIDHEVGTTLGIEDEIVTGEPEKTNQEPIAMDHVTEVHVTSGPAVHSTEKPEGDKPASTSSPVSDDTSNEIDDFPDQQQIVPDDHYQRPEEIPHVTSQPIVPVEKTHETKPTEIGVEHEPTEGHIEQEGTTESAHVSSDGPHTSEEDVEKEEESSEKPKEEPSKEDEVQEHDVTTREPESVTKHGDLKPETSTSVKIGHDDHTQHAQSTPETEEHEESSGDGIAEDFQHTTIKYHDGEDGSGDRVTKPTEKPIKRVEDVSESQELESDKKVTDVSSEISHEFDSTEDTSVEDASHKPEESDMVEPEVHTHTTSQPSRETVPPKAGEQQTVPPHLDDSDKKESDKPTDEKKPSDDESKTEVPAGKSTHAPHEQSSTTVGPSVTDSISPSQGEEDIFAVDDTKSTERPEIQSTDKPDFSVFDHTDQSQEGEIHDRVSDTDSSEKPDLPSSSHETSSQGTTLAGESEEITEASDVEKDSATRIPEVKHPVFEHVTPDEDKEHESTTSHVQYTTVSDKHAADEHTTIKSHETDETKQPIDEARPTEPQDKHSQYDMTTSYPEDVEKTEKPHESHTTEAAIHADTTRHPEDVSKTTESHEKQPDVSENIVPEDMTSSYPEDAQHTKQPEVTTQAAIEIEVEDDVTTPIIHKDVTIQDHEVEHTTKYEEITTSPHINEADNEIIEEDHRRPETYLPPRIPGEGNCLIDGKSYNNYDLIPATNKCQTSCRCVDSIVKCEHVKCSPPPSNLKNCQAVYHAKDACCPMYTCEHVEPDVIESGNQMSQEVDDDQPQQTEATPHEVVEEPIIPSVYKPDCDSEAGCEIQTKKPSEVEQQTEKHIPEESQPSTHAPQIHEIEKETEPSHGSSEEDKQDEQSITDIKFTTRRVKPETVTPSIVHDTTPTDVEERAPTTEKREEDVTTPFVEHENDTTVETKHPDTSVEDQYTTAVPSESSSEKMDVASEKPEIIEVPLEPSDDFTLRPTVDEGKPVEVDSSDKPTTIRSVSEEGSDQTTIRPRVDATTVSIDDVNKIGVSVLPTDSVDDIIPQTPDKDCEDAGCKVEAHFTRYPLDKTPTTPSSADVQKCGPHGCEDDEQNAIGSDDLQKPVCGPNGCAPDIKPVSEQPRPTEIPEEQDIAQKPIQPEVDVESTTIAKKDDSGKETTSADEDAGSPVTTAFPPSEENTDEKCEGDSCAIESVTPSSEKPAQEHTEVPSDEDTQKPQPAPSSSEEPEVTTHHEEYETTKPIFSDTEKDVTHIDDESTQAPHEIKPVEKVGDLEKTTPVEYEKHTTESGLPEGTTPFHIHDHTIPERDRTESVLSITTTTKAELKPEFDGDKQVPEKDMVTPYEDTVQTTISSHRDTESTSVPTISESDEEEKPDGTVKPSDFVDATTVKSEEDKDEDKKSEQPTTDVPEKPFDESAIDHSTRVPEERVSVPQSLDVTSSTEISKDAEESTHHKLEPHDEMLHTTSQPIQDATEHITHKPIAQEPEDHTSHDIHTTIQSIDATEVPVSVDKTSITDEKTEAPHTDEVEEPGSGDDTDKHEDESKKPEDEEHKPTEGHKDHSSAEEPDEIESQKPTTDLESTQPSYTDDENVTSKPSADDKQETHEEEPQTPAPAGYTPSQEEPKKPVDRVTVTPADSVEQDHTQQPEVTLDNRDVTTETELEHTEAPERDVIQKVTPSDQEPSSVSYHDQSTPSSEDHETKPESYEITTASEHLDEHTTPSKIYEDKKDAPTTIKSVETTDKESDEIEDQDAKPEVTISDDKLHDTTEPIVHDHDSEEQTVSSIEKDKPHEDVVQTTAQPLSEPEKHTTVVFTPKAGQPSTEPSYSTSGAVQHSEEPYDSSVEDIHTTTVHAVKEHHDIHTTERPHIDDVQPSSAEDEEKTESDEITPTTVKYVEHETSTPAEDMELHTESAIVSDKKKPESDDHTLDLTEKTHADTVTEGIPSVTTVTYKDQDTIGDRFTDEDDDKPKPVKQGETTDKPKAETTQAHTTVQSHTEPSRDATTVQPHVETSAHPHVKETIPQHVETTSQQQYDTDSDVRTTVSPHVETTSQQQYDTDADVRTTVSPHVETTSQPQYDTDADVRTTVSPHVETTSQPQYDTDADVRTTVSSHVQDTAQEQVEITDAPHDEVTIEPEIGTTVRQYADKDASPEIPDVSHTTLQSLDETTVHPQAGSTIQPHERTSTHPQDIKSQTTVNPHAETTVQPQAETTVEPQAVEPHVTAQPQDVDVSHVETTIAPDYDSVEHAEQPHDVTVQPQAETTVHEHADATEVPNKETSAQTKEPQTTVPSSSDETEHVQTTLQPHTETTVQSHDEETKSPVDDAVSTDRTHVPTTPSADSDESTQPHEETTQEHHVEIPVHPQEDKPVESQPDSDGHPHDETPIEPHLETTPESETHPETTAQPQHETTVQPHADTTAPVHAETTVESHTQQHVESTPQPAVQSTTDYIIDYITSKIPFLDRSTSKPDATTKHTTTPAEEEPEVPSVPSGSEEDIDQHEAQLPDFPGSYGSTGPDSDYDEGETFGPGTCRYGGHVYVSAQQIPRDDPCDFCFCFRSDIICLQQSCPPPIQHCREEPIQGFCCPRYECPVSMATVMNVTTTTTTTTTTLPPHFLSHAYKGQAQRRGCQIDGHVYKVGEVIKQTSGPCLHCICGADGQMKCDPKKCTPEPMLRQMIAVAATQRRRR